MTPKELKVDNSLIYARELPKKPEPFDRTNDQSTKDWKEYAKAREAAPWYLFEDQERAWWQLRAESCAYSSDPNEIVKDLKENIKADVYPVSDCPECEIVWQRKRRNGENQQWMDVIEPWEPGQKFNLESKNFEYRQILRFKEVGEPAGKDVGIIDRDCTSANGFTEVGKICSKCRSTSYETCHSMYCPIRPVEAGKDRDLDTSVLYPEMKWSEVPDDVKKVLDTIDCLSEAGKQRCYDILGVKRVEAGKDETQEEALIRYVKELQYMDGSKPQHEFTPKEILSKFRKFNP